VTSVERDAAEANIASFGDGLWWALTTMTTVGYGDRFPVTLEGRLVAAALMLAGIAVLGVLTASIAAWFLSQFRAVESTVAEMEKEVEEVEESVEDIAEAVEASVNGADREEFLAVLRDISTRLATLEQTVARVTERDGPG